MYSRPACYKVNCISLDKKCPTSKNKPPPNPAKLTEDPRFARNRQKQSSPKERVPACKPPTFSSKTHGARLALDRCCATRDLIQSFKSWRRRLGAGAATQHRRTVSMVCVGGCRQRKKEGRGLSLWLSLNSVSVKAGNLVLSLIHI